MLYNLFTTIYNLFTMGKCKKKKKIRKDHVDK